MTIRRWFSGLWNPSKSPQPARASQPTRAQLVAEAGALHRKLGEPARKALQAALLRIDDPRKLRDPQALQRLLALARARQTMNHWLGNDLRRYMVLAGLRQWMASRAEPASARKQTRKIIVKR